MDKDERITGGNKRKIQKRQAPRQSFTAAKRQVFLDMLASCANVSAAAKAAGVGVSTVYDARRREPDFAAEWEEALELGYMTLESLLLERAAKGANYVPGETIVPGPETIDTWLALDLLRLSRQAKAPRKAPGAPLRRASEQQVAESICAKLEVLERRKKRAAERGKGKNSPSPACAGAGFGSGRTVGGAKDPHPPTAARRAPPSPRGGRGGSASER
jgi:hypothetical protein